MPGRTEGANHRSEDYLLKESCVRYWSGTVMYDGAGNGEEERKSLFIVEGRFPACHRCINWLNFLIWCSVNKTGGRSS